MCLERVVVVAGAGEHHEDTRPPGNTVRPGLSG